MPKGADEAIIEPKKGKRDPALPRSCILAFTPADVEGFRKNLTGNRRSSTKIFLAGVYSGLYRDAPIAVVGPALGAPQAVLIVEKLIALGVTEIVAFGWCGSLQPGVRIGDLVLPVGAISEEGASKHYPIGPETPGPSPALLARLEGNLSQAGLTLHEGLVWSTDAPYRETVGKVSDYRSLGILAVEMEASALFALACFRGVSLAIVLTVSDDLSTLEWRHGFRDPAFLSTRERARSTLLSTLCPRREPKWQGTEPPTSIRQ
jgi:uridine phosphorylase